MALLEPPRQQRESDGKEQSPTGNRSATSTEEQSPTNSSLFTLGHGLFGAVLAFMAVDNLRNLEDMVQYAESDGAPMADFSVPAISSSLLVGSVGIALWRAPAAAASAVAAFFVTVTPVMHDFWTINDPEQRQQQQIHFLKNTALLGATLAFLGLDRRDD